MASTKTNSKTPSSKDATSLPAAKVKKRGSNSTKIPGDANILCPIQGCRIDFSWSNFSPQVAEHHSDAIRDQAKDEGTMHKTNWILVQKGFSEAGAAYDEFVQHVEETVAAGTVLRDRDAFHTAYFERIDRREQLAYEFTFEAGNSLIFHAKVDTLQPIPQTADFTVPDPFFDCTHNIDRVYTEAEIRAAADSVRARVTGLRLREAKVLLDERVNQIKRGVLADLIDRMKEVRAAESRIRKRERELGLADPEDDFDTDITIEDSEDLEEGEGL